MVKVSIVIPVFNAEEFIGRCIESIQSQTLHEWELILVDDVGDDKSMEIAKKYAKEDERIIYIESDCNVGPMIAREKGYKIASGDYITFVDADDTIPENSLEILYETAIKYQADIVTGELLRIYPNGNRMIFWAINHVGFLSKSDVYKRLLNRHFTHNICGKLFHKQILSDNILRNFRNFTYGEDGCLFFQILNYSNVIYTISDITYNYWINNSSTTNSAMCDQKIGNVVLFTKFQYDIFTKEESISEKEIRAWLYIQFSELSKKIGFTKTNNAYINQGLPLNNSFRGLMSCFSLKKAIKMYVKIHYLYYEKNFIGFISKLGHI